jgi:hypothetical protein
MVKADRLAGQPGIVAGGKAKPLLFLKPLRFSGEASGIYSVL